MVRGLREVEGGAALAVVCSLILLLQPKPAVSDSGTCNGFISISYPAIPSPNLQGSVDTVRLSLSAGDVDNGNFLDIEEFYFDLDCRNQGCSNNLQANCTVNADCGPGHSCLTLGTNCIDDGMVFDFVGNLDTTCSSDISPMVEGNRVRFSAEPPIRIAANSFGCLVEFDLVLLSGQSNDSSPTRVEQVAGFNSAPCDNGVNSSSAQSGFVAIDPPPTATPTVTATPSPTPDCLPPGAPCADDGDPCTADVCSDAGSCSHPVVVESHECETCEDLIDNDDDGTIDCRDLDCSPLGPLYDFGVIALRTTGTKNVRVGGNVHIDGILTAGGETTAGVCSRSIDVRGDASIGAVAVTARATFGESETGERIISIRDRFASPASLDLRLKTDTPFVGPGVCSQDQLTPCAENTDCGGSNVCTGRLTLIDPANSSVSRDGSSPLLADCQNALVATDAASLCFDDLPCTPVSSLPATPAGATNNDRIKTTRQIPSISMTVGGGLQVICARQLRLGPDRLDAPSELVIHGEPDTTLVMKVDRITLGAGSEVVLDGIAPQRVLWYLAGRGGGPKLLRASILPGTVFAPERSQIYVGGETQLRGGAIASRVKVLRAARIGHQPFCAPVCTPP